MRRKFARLPAVLGTAFTGAVLALNAARPAEPAKLPDPNPAANIQLVQQPAVPSVPPVQPTQPTPTPTTTPPSTADTSTTPSAAGAGAASSLAGSLLGTTGAAPSAGTGGAVNPGSTSGGALSGGQQAAPSTGSSVVGGGEAVSRASSDVGDLLGKSINALGVEVHHLSPVISDPIVRGYYSGQYLTQVNGGFWVPARGDLDTILSKIDSSQIENVVIIKGPYSVRYGPGFAFIDVETLSTPRYEGGWQVHDMTGLTYKSNGQQWFGVQSVYGGDDKFGFRVTYTGATGTDYSDGNGVKQPSGFNVQSFNADFGFDLGQYSKLEGKATHLAELDTKVPGVYYDINYLSTDAYTLRYTYDDRNLARFVSDAWFNYTRLTGDNLLPSKREQLPALNNRLGLAPPFVSVTYGLVDAEMASWGYRNVLTMGSQSSLQVSVGTDLHYLDGKSNEFDLRSDPALGGFNFFNSGVNFPVPHSYQQDPGVFLDASLPLLDNKLTIKAGIRFDWVRTAISDLNPPTPSFPNVTNVVALGGPTAPGAYGPAISAALTGPQLQRDYALWSAFITPEWKATDHVTFLAGAGYAQRPPSMTELYALEPFTAVIQNGLNFVQGNPLLAPETARQVDLGMKLNYDKFRSGISTFYSWIHNYITYSQDIGFSTAIASDTIPTSFGYQYTNTREATLAGGEFYAEWDAAQWLTFFGTAAYVDGTDQATFGRLVFNPTTFVIAPTTKNNEPLPGIPPLDTRVGFRIHDPAEQRRWAIEFTTHMVAAQDQFAASLVEQPTGGYTLFDVRTYWQASKNLLLTAGIENIGNRNYREWADLHTVIGVFQPGLNAYVGARYTY